MTAGRLVLMGCSYRRSWARRLGRWDVEIEPGELVHLWAPNGSGKSTFLRAAVGLEPARWVRREIGAIDHRPMTSVRFVASGVAPSPVLRVREYLELIGACQRTDSSQVDRSVRTWGLEPVLEHRGHELSAGQQRAVILAGALAGTPAVVMLDEPLVGLDRDRRAVLAECLRDLTASGGCALLTGHEPWLQRELGGRVIDHG